MTPVYKLSASSIKGRTNYGSMLAGNPTYTIPTSFESIATVTVGSGGASNVEFTSIGAGWTHLQLRYMFTPTTEGGKFLTLRFNNDTTTTNYRYHYLLGSGSAVESGTAQNAYSGEVVDTSNPCVTVFDILDYANTNKFKTIRELTGFDTNGNGKIYFVSNLWMSTSAITSIKLTISSGNIAQYSHFALYGIKGAA